MARAAPLMSLSFLAVIYRSPRPRLQGRQKHVRDGDDTFMPRYHEEERATRRREVSLRMAGRIQARDALISSVARRLFL